MYITSLSLSSPHDHHPELITSLLPPSSEQHHLPPHKGIKHHLSPHHSPTDSKMKVTEMTAHQGTIQPANQGGWIAAHARNRTQPHTTAHNRTHKQTPTHTRTRTRTLHRLFAGIRCDYHARGAGHGRPGSGGGAGPDGGGSTGGAAAGGGARTNCSNVPTRPSSAPRRPGIRPRPS